MERIKATAFINEFPFLWKLISQIAEDSRRYKKLEGEEKTWALFDALDGIFVKRFDEEILNKQIEFTDVGNSLFTEYINERLFLVYITKEVSTISEPDIKKCGTVGSYGIQHEPDAKHKEGDRIIDVFAKGEPTWITHLIISHCEYDSQNGIDERFITIYKPSKSTTVKDVWRRASKKAKNEVARISSF